MDKTRKEKAIILILSICLVMLIVLSLCIGRYSIKWNEIPGMIQQWLSGNLDEESKKAMTVLLVIRIPRIFLALLTGAGLSVSGAAYQGLFQNPMVSPDILGVSSGASVGAALALIIPCIWLNLPDLQYKLQSPYGTSKGVCSSYIKESPLG